MENLIYWQGKAVGIQYDNYICWYTNATPKIIKLLT